MLHRGNKHLNFQRSGTLGADKLCLREAGVRVGRQTVGVSESWYVYGYIEFYYHKLASFFDTVLFICQYRIIFVIVRFSPYIVNLRG